MINHGTKSRGWVVGVLLVVVCQMTALAQVAEVERLIHVAKSIKELIVKPVDLGDSSKSGAQQGFEVFYNTYRSNSIKI